MSHSTKTYNLSEYFQNSLDLLRQLIAIPSFSNEEDRAADLWHQWLEDNGAAEVTRFHNNVYTVNTHFNPEKPLLLLNSHMDTVRPVSTYTHNPFDPASDGERLWGLGSNDAGASGVTLAGTFLLLKDREDLPVNLLLAISASEEKMGELGMRALLPHLKEKGLYPDMAIVGEPTSLQPAIGERGLVVLDATVKGLAGHAARKNGINAIYRAVEDIQSIKNMKLTAVSDTLGEASFNVTMINAGTQHNIIPEICSYVVDARTTDAYPNEKIERILTDATKWSDFKARSTRIHPSVLPPEHPLYLSSLKLGLHPFVSPTTSDMALMHDIPSLKIGPGESSRSHSADEFIYLSEISEALELYPELILNLPRQHS